jgi:hypothetical protein
MPTCLYLEEYSKLPARKHQTTAQTSSHSFENRYLTKVLTAILLVYGTPFN